MTIINLDKLKKKKVDAVKTLLLLKEKADKAAGKDSVQLEIHTPKKEVYNYAYAALIATPSLINIAMKAKQFVDAYDQDKNPDHKVALLKSALEELNDSPDPSR